MPNPNVWIFSVDQGYKPTARSLIFPSTFFMKVCQYLLFKSNLLRYPNPVQLTRKPSIRSIRHALRVVTKQNVQAPTQNNIPSPFFLSIMTTGDLQKGWVIINLKINQCSWTPLLSSMVSHGILLSRCLKSPKPALLKSTAAIRFFALPPPFRILKSTIGGDAATVGPSMICANKLIILAQ